MPARLNPGGGLKQEKIWRDAVLRAVKRKIDGGTTAYLEVIADKVVALAVAGDMAAVQEIGNRLDGRAPQSLFEELPEGGRLVLVWESPGTSESQSPTLPESNSSPFTIEHSAIPSASPTEGPEKPLPTSTSLSEEP